MSRSWCLPATVALIVLTAPLGAQEHHGQHGEPHHQEHGDGHGAGFHHDFSDAEHWSQVFDSAERDAWQKPAEVVALMDLEPGMTVVDLGAGTGYFLGPLSAAVGGEGRVLGLDVEESLVTFMTKRAEREGWTNVTPRRVPSIIF